MSSSMNAASKAIWQVSGISLCPSAGTGFGSCRRACWPGTIARPSRHRRRLNRCFGRRHPFLRRRNMNSMAGSPGPDSVNSVPCRRAAAASGGLSAHHRQLEIWAENCPENFENRAALVGAEIARIEGRALDAEQLYEQAIRSARANGFVHNEALAQRTRRALLRWRAASRNRASIFARCQACYLRWGADGKVRQLDRAISAPEGGRTGPRSRASRSESRSSGWISRPC